MTNVEVVGLLSEHKTDFNATSVLLKDGYIYVGTNDGALVIYEITLQNKLSEKRRIPNLVNGSIESIMGIEDAFVVLSNGSVSIFDTTTISLQETLPFKQISHISSYKSKKSSYLAISTKFMIIVYIWTGDQFELLQIHNSIHYGHLHLLNPKRIQFHSQYSFFNQQTSIIPSGNEVLLAKGSHASKIGLYDVVDFKGTHWDFNPHSIEFISPFLLLFTGNHVRFMDFANLKIYQTLPISKVSLFHSQGEKIVFTSRDSILLYQFGPLEKIINVLEKENLQQAIELVQQLNISQYADKSLKLRSLEIESGIQLFNSKRYAAAIRKFSEFIAPPMKVISLFPSYISGKASPGKSANHEDEDETHDFDPMAIQLLTHYLSDIRRKFNKVLVAEGNEIDYHDSKLTPSAFTEDKYSLDEIRTLIDSTLFRCYTEMNSGLIGSLVRVDNYCDTDLSLHEEALELLVKLSKDSNLPDLVVKYLQKLKNDNLGLVLKYADWPISIMESYGIEIFLNSQYAESFNRKQVIDYLASKSQNLERIYLEYIIVELGDETRVFNTRLVEIYYKCLKHEDDKRDSIYYKKLYTFLQSGNYDAAQVLKMVPNDEHDHLKLLKTFILKRLGHHEEALKILVLEIHDSKSAIHYINELFSKDTKLGTKYFLRLITLFWKNDDKASILQLLSTSKDSNIPLVDILKTLPPDFKVFEIEQVLIKSLRLQQRFNSFSNLSKNLRVVENVKVEEKLLDLQKQKVEVISNETKCQVCRSFLANSVLSRFPDGTLVHFGCAKAYESLKDSENKNIKLKTIKLKDYTIHNVV
ncbi:unnamed protein product [Wickerhamomyces anomalus]